MYIYLVAFGPVSSAVRYFGVCAGRSGVLGLPCRYLDTPQGTAKNSLDFTYLFVGI